MKFVMGDILGFGIVGFAYHNTTGYLLSRAIVIGLIVFAIIGLGATIKWLFGRRKQKESAGDKWLRTGKF